MNKYIYQIEFDNSTDDSNLIEWFDENDFSVKIIKLIPLVVSFKKEEEAYATILKYGTDVAKYKGKIE